MSEEEVVEVMDIFQKNNDSSESKKSEVVELESNQPWVESSSGMNIDDDKGSSTEILKQVPETDSSKCIESSEQEHSVDSDVETVKEDLLLSTKETDKSVQGVDKSNRQKKRSIESSKQSKRQRLESCSGSENMTKLPKVIDSSRCSVIKKIDNGAATSGNLPSILEFLNRERIPQVNINNWYFYTPQTLNIHKEYLKLFDFKKFHYARLLDIKSYGKNVRMEEIPLFLSRFLLEDLIDFFDYLNGTKAKYYRQDYWTLSEELSELAQVLFVRKNFQTGIQQLESQTINHLLKLTGIYISDEENSKISITNAVTPKPVKREDIDLHQSSPNSEASELIDLVSVSGSSECGENSAAHSPISNPKDDTLLQLDPEIKELSIIDRVQYLDVQKREIVKFVFRCICDTRFVLDFCLEPDYRDDNVEAFEQRLKNYLSEVKKVLETLVKMREESISLRNKAEPGNDKSFITELLDIKIRVANAFKELLQTLSSINAVFLESYFP